MTAMNSRSTLSATAATARPANVTFVREDAAGYLWFGTDDGLYRHDRRYNTYACYAASDEGPCRLSSDDVLCMDETADGALWVGTGNGLNRIDPSQNTCTVVAPPSEGFPAITAVICRANGTVWFGDNGGSLWRTGDGGECVRIPAPRVAPRRQGAGRG